MPQTAFFICITPNLPFMPSSEALQLPDKVALITGGSRGIGLAIARTLGQAGARVVICGRKEASLKKAVDSLRSAGIEAEGVSANLGQAEAIPGLVADALAAFGRLDIVVNNAATNPVFGPLQDTPEWAYDKILAVNLKGPFLLCRAALPHLRASGKGVVINISSIGGLSPEPMLGIYSVSKAALLSLTKVMAKEWGPLGIRANAICPGLIRTDFSEALWSNEAILNDMMQQQPLPRVGEPEEIAELALFLASEASAFCTGAVFTADGGYTI